MVDNRQIGEGCRPNNSILVTCDHATNDLKMLATSDQEKLEKKLSHKKFQKNNLAAF